MTDGPKLGEEIMQPLVITDAAAAPEPEPLPVPVPPLPRRQPSILLEGGSWVDIQPGQKPKTYRVYGLDGVAYDHCADDPDTGEWLYQRLG